MKNFQEMFEATVSSQTYEVLAWPPTLRVGCVIESISLLINALPMESVTLKWELWLLSLLVTKFHFIEVITQVLNNYFERQIILCYLFLIFHEELVFLV